MYKYLLVILFLFSSSFVYSNESELTISQQLERLQREVSDLSKEVFSNSTNQSNATNNDFVKNLSAIDLRIYEIENDIKNLYSNLEDLSFQFDDILEKLENFELILNNIQSTSSNNIDVNDDLTLENGTDGKVNTFDTDNTKNTLGTLNISKSSNNNTVESTSVEDKQLVNESNNVISPEDQFQASLDNIRNKKWNEAKVSFERFILDNPDNQLSGSAHYWLGELYMLEKNFGKAAITFTEGFQKFPGSIKAPDMLLKLSESLYKINKKFESCKITDQLLREFPKSKIISKAKKQFVEYNCLENE